MADEGHKGNYFVLPTETPKKVKIWGQYTSTKVFITYLRFGIFWTRRCSIHAFDCKKIGFHFRIM